MDSSKDILILALETSTDACSVALSRNGQTIDFDIVTEPRMQTSRLAPMTDGILRRNGIGAKDCAAVAVSSGPGSYTGLRVGVSMAKGLCFGASVPLIAVNTLDLLAAQGLSMYKSNHGEKRADAVVPMIDARRMEVYTAIYSSDGQRLTDIEPRIIESLDSLASSTPAIDLSSSVILFIGDGVAKCESVLSGPGRSFRQECPRASAMKAPAMREYAEGAFRNTAYFEPFYLKDFVATVGKKLF